MRTMISVDLPTISSPAGALAKTARTPSDRCVAVYVAVGYFHSQLAAAAIYRG